MLGMFPLLKYNIAQIITALRLLLEWKYNAVAYDRKPSCNLF